MGTRSHRGWDNIGGRTGRFRESGGGDGEGKRKCGGGICGHCGFLGGFFDINCISNNRAGPLGLRVSYSHDSTVFGDTPSRPANHFRGFPSDVLQAMISAPESLDGFILPCRNQMETL
jgi:hypothetical protein